MTTKTNENGEEPFFRIVEGVPIPAIFETVCGRPMEEHVELLKAMEMRPDDVMLMAFGKAGTHWIWEVLHMLVSGKAEYETRSKELAMVEAMRVEKLESQPSPRIWNSHLPFHLLPRQMTEKKVKVVHVYRNPKDILVSAYFHLRQQAADREFTLEDIERMLISPEAPGMNYIAFLRNMDTWRKNHPDYPLFTMSYEDSKEDPEKIIKDLADFLGVKTSPELRKDITEATSFTKMKEADKNKQHITEAPEIKMYRKGQVGDWKNYLTVAQSERIDAAMKELESCDYRFRFTL